MIEGLSRKALFEQMTQPIPKFIVPRASFFSTIPNSFFAQYVRIETFLLRATYPQA